MELTQLINSNGNAIKNQFIIHDDNQVTFQSYDSKIATYDRDTKTLKLYGSLWDYSRTTRNHFKTFVNNFTPFEYGTRDKFLQMVLGDNKIIIE
jgi:hypothetical protein